MAEPDLDFDFDDLELDDVQNEGQETEATGYEGPGQGGGTGRAGGTEGTEGSEGQEATQVSRAERRIQALANKTRDADKRAQEFEAQNRLLMQQMQDMQRGAQQYNPQAEQEALAAMDPVERMTYTFNRQMQNVQQSTQQQQLMMLDMMDRNTYQAKAATNPVFKRFEAEVEKIRAVELSKNRHFSREEILAFVVGQQMLKGKKSTKQPETVAKKKASQTVRTGSVSSDAGSSRGKPSEHAARAKRLENLKF